MYTITEALEQNEGPVRWHFRLERVAGQEPIRYGTGPGSRPNAVELEEYATAIAQQRRARQEHGAPIGDADAGENEEGQDGDDDIVDE